MEKGNVIYQNKASQRNENAFTGLELSLLLLAALIVIGYVGYDELSHGSTLQPEAMQKQNQGIVPDALTVTSNLLMSTGGMAGYPAVDGTISDVPVLFTSQNPAVLGAFVFTVQPFMMTAGPIDMGHASVFWMSGNDSEKLARVQSPPLVCPNWTITKKLNFIPLKSADQDLLLEDTEQFVLLVCPAGHVAPYEQFTITIAPQNGEILSLSRTVPFKITPFAILG